MKTTVFILLVAVGACFGITTITVSDFINTPVWQRGGLASSSPSPNYLDAGFANGVGIILNDLSPVLVFRENSGSHTTIESSIICNVPKIYSRRATTNGKIFVCHNTVFEIDESRNIINVQNSTFDSYTSRVMSDDTIVWKNPNDGYLYTYKKDSDGIWQQVASQYVYTYLGFSMHETWMVYYQSRGGPTYIAARQPDYSWNIIFSFPTNYQYGESDCLLYTGSSLVVGNSGYFDKKTPRAYSSKVAVKTIQYGFGGADAWVVVANITNNDMGSDLKPGGGLGNGLLYIDDNTVIVSAPYDNYNFTRIQNGGSAFVFKRQQDNTWQFVTKFVQSSPDTERLHQAVGYDNGRLYFYACRTGYGDGNFKRARNECGFKYATWSP